MATFLSTDASGCNRRIAIAVARFNRDITDPLLEGARQTLLQRGVAENDIDVVYVPGAFELPLVCRRLAGRGHYQAVIALGCVIRGDTPHFDFVAGECARGCMHSGMEHEVPVIFGVLTTDTLAQARQRADLEVLRSSDQQQAGRDTKESPNSNKGAEAALAALEMAALLEQL